MCASAKVHNIWGKEAVRRQGACMDTLVAVRFKSNHDNETIFLTYVLVTKQAAGYKEIALGLGSTVAYIIKPCFQTERLMSIIEKHVILIGKK